MGKKEPKVKRKWVHVAWWCSKMVSNMMMMMMMMTVRVCLVVDVLRIRGCDWWCSLYFIEDWKFHKCLTPSHWPFIHLTFPSSYDMIWRRHLLQVGPLAQNRNIYVSVLSHAPSFVSTQLNYLGMVYSTPPHIIIFFHHPFLVFSLSLFWRATNRNENTINREKSKY